MATLTIRRISDVAAQTLRERAATEGKSVEAFLRDWIEDMCAPAEPVVIGWVWGRTTEGQEGWKPQVEGGAVLDYIDDDIDAPASAGLVGENK